MYDLAVKNGKIVGEDGVFSGDLYCKNGKIAAIVQGETPEAARIVDAQRKLIFPGAVDCHMHIGEYGADFEDMQTSTAAAAAGGVTTCIDMPLNLYSPSVLTGAAVTKKIRLLSQESYVDFAVWGGLTPASIPHLREMHEAGAVSFKCFMSGGGNDFQAPTLNQIRDAMRMIAEFGGLAGFHCEDFSIISEERERVRAEKQDGRQAFLDSRPVVAEVLAVQNIITLAEETGARVHICHVSAPEAAVKIQAAQRRGVDITAETCPHFLTFTEQDYLENGCLFGCAPPLRSVESREALWGFVKDGTLSCIASDHSPGMPENRSDAHQPTYDSGYGISGVQTMFQTVYSEGQKRGISPEILARALSAAPAKRWGLYGKKGAVKVGFDADFVIFNPDQHWQVHAEKLLYKQKITAFDGLTGTGTPETTYLRGEKIAENGKVLAKSGRHISID